MRVADLIAEYGKQPVPHARAKASNMRCALSKAGNSLGLDLLNQQPDDLASQLPEVEAAVMSLPNPMKSTSAWRASIRTLFRFGLEVRAISGSIEAVAKRLGYPVPTKVTCPKRLNEVRKLYEALIRTASARHIVFAKLAADDITAFAASFVHDESVRRSASLAFAKWWNDVVLDHGRPDLQLQLPSRQAKRYKLSLEELPEALRDELIQARQRRLGKDTAAPPGRKPVRERTAELEVGDLLRLYGWIREHNVDLALCNKASDAITEARIAAYLDDRNEVAKSKYNDSDNGYGKTQESLLYRLTSFAEHGLRDPGLAAICRKLRVHHARNFFARREPEKDPGVLNDYFRVALRLLEMANAVESRLSEQDRIHLIHDAVVFILFGSIPYRRGICAGLRIGDSFVKVDDVRGAYWRVRVPKKKTKPGKRMMNHDVPVMFTWLIDFYVERVRLHAVRGNHEQLFLNEHGAPLADARLWHIVDSRSQLILGVRHNPHQIRKAWATDWLNYSNGDYVTAASMMDSTPGTIQDNYEFHPTAKAMARMDTDLDALCGDNFVSGGPNSDAKSRAVDAFNTESGSQDAA